MVESSLDVDAPLAVGIDIGTTNIKVVLLQSVGGDQEQPIVLGAASVPVETTHNGPAVTQDGEQIWQGVLNGVKQAVASAALHHANHNSDHNSDIAYLSERVVTIGVCSQYSSIVPIDAAGHPVGPVITYMDHRGEDECFEILSRHEDAFELWLSRHGIPPIGAGLSLSHILYLQQHEPELHERTHAYVEVMDYITARLTGTITSTIATSFALQLCNNQLHLDQEFAVAPTYDADLIERSGVDETKLAPLIAVDESPGTLSTTAAAALGLRPGIVVAPAMNDTHAGAYATGAISEHIGGVMIGTTAVYIDTTAQVGTDIEHELVAMPAPEAATYLVMAENGVAGRAVEHMLQTILSSPASVAATGADPFEEVQSAVTASPPGANGLLFLPWVAGSMAPKADGAMRGGFLGLSVTHTRADMIRALIEGTIHNLRWLMGPVETLTGHKNREIVFGGGAARSPEWAQVTANLLNCTVSVLDQPEIGAARAVGTVALARVRHSTPAPVPVAQRFTPQVDLVALYDALHQVFAQAYEATHPLMTQLSVIAASEPE